MVITLVKDWFILFAIGIYESSVSSEHLGKMKFRTKYIPQLDITILNVRIRFQIAPARTKETQL